MESWERPIDPSLERVFTSNGNLILGCLRTTRPRGKTAKPGPDTRWNESTFRQRVPIIGVFALLSLPYLRYDVDSSGILMVSCRGRWTALAAAILALIITPAWVLLGENGLGPGPGQWFPDLPGVIGNGVVPASLLFGTVIGFYLLLRKGFATTRNGAVQAVFILAATGFLVLTLTGVWFRGAGMSLAWPWAG